MTAAAGALVLATLAAPVRVDVEASVSRELAPLYVVDGAYMQLAPELPAHGTPRLAGERTAVAPVTGTHAYRGLLGQTVFVDGTCAAKVTGFAVVARVAGTPDYAPGNHAAWTADNVLANGAPVLAATLDGCTGTFATPAPIAQPRLVSDPALARRARAKLLASGAAYDAQYVFEEAGGEGAWAANAEIETLVVEHHGIRYVAAHATLDEGCGGAQINLWGLYRGRDLAVVAQGDLDVWTIERLVDVDGDGTLEIAGKPWLQTDTVIVDRDGEQLARWERPFYGCAC